MSGKRETTTKPPKFRATEQPQAVRAAARELSRRERGPTGHEGAGRLDRYFPPPEHRRCQHKHVSGNGERCRRWNMPGSRFCHRHRGRADCYIARWLAGDMGLAPTGAMAGTVGLTEEARVFYTSFLSKTLEDKLRETLDMDESEQTSLYEDLALARQAVGATVELFAVAEQCHEASPTEKSLQHKIACGQIMREAQRDLLDMVDAVGKQEERRAQRTGVSVAALAYVARQLTSAAARIYGDDLEKAREFERAARSIRLPDTAREIAGTTLTPDQDVLAMDATVPDP